MKTYQDFLEIVGDENNIINTDEKALGDFILDVISDHEANQEFKTGKIAGEFYRHHDPYQEKIDKLIYDNYGNATKDKYSPNHKLTANWHFIFTTELVSHLLGNGISFDNPEIKEKLGGSKFDTVLQQILTYAANDGVGFGIVTDSGVEPLCFASDNAKPYFAPLKDENDGEIKAGVKYWRLATDKPMIAVLYTLNGYIKFKEYTGENNKSGMSVIEPLTPYTLKTVSNDIEGDYITEGENYSSLPIIPMYYINNQSSIVGNEETLLNYDLNLSGFTNDTIQSLIYWILTGYDGMDTEDDRRFLNDLYKRKLIHNEENQSADPHQIEVQYQAREAALTRLEQQLIRDYMAADTKSLRSGAITTVEIKSAYKDLERKCDLIEEKVREFVRGILRIYGIDENEPFHFTRPKEINESEAINTLIASAPYTNEEYTTKKILEVRGDIDEYENIQKQKASEEMNIFDDEKQESTITKIAELIFQKLKQLFTFGKRDDENAS